MTPNAFLFIFEQPQKMHKDDKFTIKMFTTRSVM